MSYQPNMGVAAALKIGMDVIAKSEKQFQYIFRFDSDDINLKERLEAQVKFMESNPDVDIAGSSIEVFNDANDK